MANTQTLAADIQLPKKERIYKYSNDRVQVYFVDGEYIRSKIDIDFIGGGHDYVYDWIPAGEIWLDDRHRKEYQFILLHELHERNKMIVGETYNRAHSDANYIEGEARDQPQSLEALIAQEMAKSPKLAASNQPLILRQYPYGRVPKKMRLGVMNLGGSLGVTIPPPRGTPMPPKKPRAVAENAVLRTDEKLDGSVKHLGYEPTSLSQEEFEALGRSIPTDVEIINDSQKRLRGAEVVPDEKLGLQQLAHLTLARVVAGDIFHTPVSIYAAIIPAASDRVKTAGLYGTTSGIIYINLDQLHSGRKTIDTLVHELGHYHQYQQTKIAEDLSPAHAEAMTSVASKVVDEVSRGKFNDLLKGVVW